MQIYTLQQLKSKINSLSESDIKKIRANKKQFICFDTDIYGTLYPRFTNSERNNGLFMIDEFEEAISCYNKKQFNKVA